MPNHNNDNVEVIINVESHNQTGGITTGFFPDFPPLDIQVELPKGICAKHGKITPCWITVSNDLKDAKTFHFCQYCCGEFIAEHFPVTEV